MSGRSADPSITGEPGRAPLRPGVNLVGPHRGDERRAGHSARDHRPAAHGPRPEGRRLADGRRLRAPGTARRHLPRHRHRAAAPPPRGPHGSDRPLRDVPGPPTTGYLNVCVPNNKFWAAFCEALGRARPRRRPRKLRHQRRAASLGAPSRSPRLAARFRTGTRDQWIERLLARGIPAGPVHTLDEVVKDGYLDEAGMLTRIDPSRRAGTVVVPSYSHPLVRRLRAPSAWRRRRWASTRTPPCARTPRPSPKPDPRTTRNLEPVDGRPSMKTLQIDAPARPRPRGDRARPWAWRSRTSRSPCASATS